MKTIRKLKLDDAEIYFQHLNRVYDKKGLMSVHDNEWVEEQRKTHVTIENVQGLLTDEVVSIWGEFDSDGLIIKSLRSETALNYPMARLINFKSESTGVFKPVQSLLPMLDVALRYYEGKEIYSFYLLRRLDWFSFRKNVFWEDNPPLDRYNSYYDEILEPGQESKNAAFRLLAGNITYPVKTAIVHMCLKQEHRKFGNEIYYPDTKEMHKVQLDKERTVCVLGVTPGKLGAALCDRFSQTGSQIIPLGRKEIDFYDDNWRTTLLEKIPGTTKPLTIIINLYDHSPGRGYIQEQIFDCLWAKYKTYENVQIVAIGSMAHYHALEGIPEEYVTSKRNLRNKVAGFGRLGVYKCRLMFLEPGVIEAYLETKPTWAAPYFMNAELADKILKFSDANDRFLFLMANGNHWYIPTNDDK